MRRLQARSSAPGRRPVATLLALCALALASPAAAVPNVLLLTVDTLRADRLSAYGYPRPTSPHLDRLFAAGVRFSGARTVEPLTGPGVTSLLTSLHPHEHGATRNGLPMRPRLPSLPKLLRRQGYRTAAFVGNWTLRDKLSGLGEHFEVFQDIVSRKRWFLFTDEATADDLNEAALEWLQENLETAPGRPFLLWIHYVEPHAPYRLWEEHAPRLGVPVSGETVSRSDRYDTEVAYVDQRIGLLLAALEKLGVLDDTLIAFASDHGESLGEHGYWGHGRNAYEPSLAIPMSLTLPRRLRGGQVQAAPSLLIDLAPTILGLLGLPGLEGARGLDWADVLTRGAPPPRDRITAFQAHKGAVSGGGDGSRARENGLLEVAILRSGMKEVLRVRSGDRRLFDLAADPAEAKSLVAAASPPSPELTAWLHLVREGLEAAGDLPVGPLDEESLARMKALGYVD